MSRMWSQILLCFLVGFTYASQNPGWKENSEYVYQLRGRSLASLNQLSSDYSGIALKAKLAIRPNPDGNLYAQISEPQYAQIHAKLYEGWDSDFSDSQLGYQQLPISTEPFKIVMKNGAVRDVVVSQQLTNWEANVIKSIASQLQLDTEATNLIDSHINILTQEGSNTAVYKTMEETVTGVSETLYEIHPLPEYVLQTSPWLAPLNNLQPDDDMIEVVKSKNFTHSEYRPSYHFGFHGVRGYEPSANKIGEFVQRTSVTRAVISGSLQRFTVQSSVTEDQIVIRPTMNNKQHGSVNTKLNITLLSVEPQSQGFDQVSNPVSVGVVYRFNDPFGSSNEPRPAEEYDHQTASSSAEAHQSSPVYYAAQQYGNSQRSKRAVHPKSSRRSYSYSPNSPFDEEDQSWYQDQPQLNEPPASPLLPLTVGYEGQSIKQQQNIAQNARKLAQQIGQEVQQPDDIPSQNTIGKFVILSSLLRLMGPSELQQVASQLYTKQHQGPQGAAWVAYRDAVAQAGTGPALTTIQEWIKSSKISGEEAAEVVAVAANSVRQPTESYMKAYFQMVKSDEVISQAYLNESALLSYARLVHQVYVHGEVSHGKYPVHSFGTFHSTRGLEFMKNEVIPYLTQQLHNAVSNADTQNIHAYIRALGNVGHQHILEAFEPYLEGNKQASQFQRVLMVVALDKLAESNPRVARSVLYKIYQNPADHEQVRVAAVLQLMRTSPPADMLQRMASYTNIDPNHYVNSAVKSAIQSASQLKGAEYDKLRSSAQSAKPLLTDQEYGVQYSKTNLSSYVAEQMKLTYKQSIQTFGGADYLLPKGIAYFLRGRFGGVKRQVLKAQAMVSSVEDLVNVFEQQTEEYQKKLQQKQAQNAKEHPWSSEYVAQLLSMENDQREQLEGQVYLKLGALQKVFSFDNQTIEDLPQSISDIEDDLKNGKQFHYSKLFNSHAIALSFPTELGLPFIYTYDKPTFIRVRGNVKANASPPVSSGSALQKPDTLNSEFEIHVVASGRSQSQFGFITPYDHQRYSAGYDKNFQIHLPIQGKIEANVQNGQIKAEIHNPGSQKDVNLLHFSTVPYTAKNDIYNPQPEKQVIQKKHPQVVNKVFGKHATGIAWYLQINSDQHLSTAWLYEKLYNEDLVSDVVGPWLDENIQHTEINVGIDADQSSANKVLLRLGYQHGYTGTNRESGEGDDMDLSIFTNIPHEPIKRQKEFMKKASGGLKNLNVYVVDASAAFEGQNQIKYIATAAVAKSDIGPYSRFLAHVKKQIQQDQQYQASLIVKSHVPNTNGLDLNYAMQFDPTSKIHIKAAVGKSISNSTIIDANVQFSQSEQRKQYLREQPAYQECQRQMQEGNKQLPICAKMTAKANLLDQISAKINYDNMSPSFRNQTYKLYSMFRHYLYPRFQENVIVEDENQSNSLDIEAQFSPDLSYANVSADSDYGSVEVDYIPVSKLARTLFVPHPVFHVKARLMGYISGYDTYRPICVIDKSAASTLDNKTYPVSLGSDWTVLLQYVPRRPSSDPSQIDQPVPEQLNEQIESYVVYARAAEQGPSHKEIKIVLQAPDTQGKVVEITLKPAEPGQSPKLYVNKEKVKYDSQPGTNIYSGFIKAYKLPNNEMKLEVHRAFYVIYDGVRAKLTMVYNSKFRDASRGLCGTFTGEPETDFLSPKNCIIQDPEEFVASYTVPSQNSPNQRLTQLKNKAESQQCYQKKVQYANVISSADAGRHSNNNYYHSYSSPLNNRGSCTQHQTQYVEQGNEICFTRRPLPVCKPNCQQRGSVSKNISVHCVQATSAANLWKREIQKGASPDFSMKPETRTIRMNVPQSCV